MQHQTKQCQEKSTDSKYLSVKDFARHAGVSTQWVYKRLANELQPYCKIINGVKYINVEGLRLFDRHEQRVDIANGFQSGEQELVQHFATTLQSVAKDLINSFQPNTDALQDTLTTLTTQLATKDAQIAAQNEQIKYLTTMLQISQDQQAALQSALTTAQALHAGSIKQQLSATTASNCDDKKPSKGVFRRFFKRNKKC
ncbi:MAG: hypothetical protein II059_11005 [Clostridia bacterium]|nr:hypothetical protein [Clostridia bacterium]